MNGPISKSTIDYQNNRFTVVKKTLENSGRVFYVVEKPHAVLVIPRFLDFFLIMDVVRPHTSSQSFEFVGGRIDPGETPINAACRELTEETGLESKSITEIGIVMPLPSLTNEKVTGFVATISGSGAEPPVPRLERSEGILSARWVDSSSLVRYCKNGSINCSVDAFFGLIAACGHNDTGEVR